MKSGAESLGGIQANYTMKLLVGPCSGGNTLHKI